MVNTEPSWREFLHMRRTDTCIMLGSGPSINKIDTDGWKKIGKYDTFAWNNWVYHPTFVPRFYALEVKKKRNFIQIGRRFKEKWDLYRDVNFLIHKSSEQSLSYVVIKGMPNIYLVRFIKRDRKREHKLLTSNYQMNKKSLTASYNASMTAWFELLYRMGYSTIILYGVDLLNSYYFWAKGDFGETHCQWNKQCFNRDPDLPHTVYPVKDFIVDFDKRWMRAEGKKIVVGHKETALYPDLEYMDFLKR